MALKIFAPLVALVGVALSAPIYPVPLHYVALLTPIPENIYNQVQDTKSGEYAFGYAGGPVAREEAKTSDGVIRGAYSYIDAYGIVQHYRYIADDNGFRVIGTNIPTDAAANEPSQLQEQVKIDDANSSDKPEEHSSSRRKRSVLYHAIESVEAIPAVPLAAVASVPIATSSQNRFQIHNENLKTEISSPAETIASDAAATLQKVESAGKNADGVATVVAGSLPTSTSSQIRHQIHSSEKTELHTPVPAIPTEEIAAAPVASVAIPIELKNVEAIPVAAAAAVATATSSQSRYQVHNSQKTKLYSSGVPVAAIAAAPATSLNIESPGAALIGVAATVPISTSSQSRSQVHNNFKTEILEPVATIPVQTLSAAPATSLNIKSPGTASVGVAASVPISTSSQSRFQVHNNVKTEILEPVATIPVQTVAAVPATPLTISATLKSAEILPVAASLPTSTSSQSRFQIHSSQRTEIHAPAQTIPLQTVATVPATPFAVAASVPIASSSQQRFQSHDSSETLPALATASTSDRLVSQVDSNSRVPFEKLSQSPKFELVALEPVNAFSEPSLARHRIGVGLGVVPSPLVAYHTFESPSYA